MSRQETEASHIPSTRRNLCAAVVALFTAVVPGSATGLGLGDLQVRSFIGEPLDASVVIFATEEEEISTECFSLGAPSPGGVPSVVGARLALEQTGRRSSLRVRTDQAMTEPVMRFRLTSTCSNAGGLARDYVLLLDPRPAGVASPRVTLPAPPDPRPASRAVASVMPAPPATVGTPPAPAAPAKSPAPPTPAAKRAAPAESAKPKAAPEPKGEAKAPAAPPAAAVPAKAAPTPARDGPEAPFRLRLSGPEIDTSRGAVDERRRAEIRERRLLLEQDDQTAVILRLRESLRQLEGQLATIQQQVAAAPASVPGKAASLPAVPSPAPTPEPAKSPDAPPFAPKPPPAKAPAVRPAQAGAEGAVDWPWLVAGVLFALVAVGLSLWKRRKEQAPASDLDSPITYSPQAPSRPGFPVSPSAPPKAAAKPSAPKREPRLSDPGAASESAGQPAAAPEEQVDLGTLRRRYRQARFPELMEGTVSLGDAASVIRGARTLYEDGDAARAIEFLELAIADNSKPVELWLALFEVFRQEGLAAEFGALAARFHREHGNAPQWSKVQSIGREFDPDNSLFVSDKGDTFNPLTDNWLGIPADFSADGVAAQLHAAGLTAARGRRAG